MKASTAISNRLARQSSAIDDIRKDAKFNQQCNQEALRTKLNRIWGIPIRRARAPVQVVQDKRKKKILIVDKVVCEIGIT